MLIEMINKPKKFFWRQQNEWKINKLFVTYRKKKITERNEANYENINSN